MINIKTRNMIFVGLSLIILIATITGCDQKMTTAPTQIPKVASSLSNVVTGTGVLEAKQDFEVAAKVMGEVIEAPFEEGKAIAAGDILYRIDQKTLVNNIEKARLGIERAQIAYNQNEDNINKLSVRSNINGTITNLYIHSGDMVMANGKVADIVNNDVMILKVPFLDAVANGVNEGQSASVMLEGSFQTIKGTVKKVGSGQIISSGGSLVKMVEISLPNPGTLAKGDKARAYINNVACNEIGILDYSDYQTIIAEVAGKVEELKLSIGDHLTQGDIAVKLKNEALMDLQEQNSLTVKDARLTFENLNNQLNDYNIVSTINGIAIKKTIDKGDSLNATNMGKMAIIADLSQMIFKMNVDELDVSKISVGQIVSFTADALPGNEFKGVVTFVSSSGMQVSGVSLYEIKVGIENPKGLMPGMNVNAKIIVK